jgi:hypothetical protein
MDFATILLWIALGLLVAAACGVSTRIHLGWAGMACFVASVLVAGGALV